MEMMRAVCGFYFSENREHIVLIRKKRPDWQAGSYNGVGGKIEDTEFAKDAMRREFLEETGVDVENWEPFCVLNDEKHEFEVTYYRAFGSNLADCKTVTDEEVEVCQVAAVFSMPVVHNLSWLVPMALDQQVTNVSATWRDA